MTYRLWTEDELDLVRAWSKARLPIPEQARRLDRTVGALRAQRRRMVDAGRLDRADLRNRAWTVADDALLRNLIAKGWNYDRIATHPDMHRTWAGVRLRCQKKGWGVVRSNLGMSAQTVAHTLGLVGGTPVRHWIDRGWLGAINAARGDNPMWLIPLEQLWAFMENEDTWMAWRPEKVTDPDLRAWALDLRRNEVPWLRVSEVAARYHFSRDGVYRWIAMGWIPSVRYGAHWIRESSLVGWVPPSDQPDWRKRGRADHVRG